MELYGLNPARNGSQSGHQPADWAPSGGETGLEESMWQLGLGSSESYPERPGVPDCAYYMRTGFCGYGRRCRYNHPRDRAAVAAAVRATGDYPERPGEPACQFYLKTGTCKFGASCKFHHPKHAAGSLSRVPLNSYGYPLRQGEKECSYYLKTGQCKFGITCKFHHPQPAGSSMPASAPQFYPPVQSPTVTPVPEQYGGAATSLRVARPTLLPGSYVPGAYGHVLISPGVVSMTGWNPYSAPVSPALSPGAQPAVGGASLYDVAQLSSSSSALTVAYPPAPSPGGPSRGSQKEQVFPERPGEPECQYYLRTGDCKFGSSCRFHHPRDRILQGPNFVLSPLGLPLRPGVQPCSFYLQNGHCKFGSICKFDHPIGPMRYNPSASSLIDVPVAPYPVGSLLGGTLAPPSSELRSELIPGSSMKDSYPSVRVPSGSNTTSSVGLMFSQTGAVSISDVQLPVQSSAPLSSSRNTKEGGDVRISS
ncbi:zinc finger CCCH domain-containing protein 32 [Punica granatum]|uniref:Zinc finger CCCH domain-containing protein 32 n=2 Tax=Punica granatum TaxID=22663 RepID=A0A6P8E4L8_PUNGR|nr:zinc finger CCCH domain-containing protein 32 [Punica granatum]PKI42194.1 hypothetical protein CRG98_037433 [Punica granatum]